MGFRGGCFEKIWTIIPFFHFFFQYLRSWFFSKYLFCLIFTFALLKKVPSLWSYIERKKAFFLGVPTPCILFLKQSCFLTIFEMRTIKKGRSSVYFWVIIYSCNLKSMYNVISILRPPGYLEAFDVATHAVISARAVEILIDANLPENKRTRNNTNHTVLIKEYGNIFIF